MTFTPQVIGNYLLLQRIAAGGMCEVYRGFAKGAGKFQKQVAIKKILSEFHDEVELAQMFEHEAHLASQLNHANIVQVYDFVKLDGTYLLVMELIEGKSVRQLLARAREKGITLETGMSAFIINRVCRGLDYAHSRLNALTGAPLGIVHRDVSPENIMLSYEGEVKLVDFGIARARDAVVVTRPDVIKGKLNYLSPEYALGKGIDSRADIFSVGLVFYELLTGDKVFKSETIPEALAKVVRCEIKPLREVNPSVSIELERIIMTALSREPEARFPSAAELCREVQRYLSMNHPKFLEQDLANFLQTLFASEREEAAKQWEEVSSTSWTFLSIQDDPVREDDKTIEPSLNMPSISALDVPREPSITANPLLKVPAQNSEGAVEDFPFHLWKVVLPSTIFIFAFLLFHRFSRIHGVVEQPQAWVPPPVAVEKVPVNPMVRNQITENPVKAVSLPPRRLSSLPPIKVMERRPARGRLVLTVSRPVSVSLDGKFVSHLQARKPFTLMLTAGTKHRVRFSSASGHIDRVSIVRVRRNKTLRRYFHFPRPNHRHAPR